MTNVNTASVFASFDRFAATTQQARADLCAALKAQGLTTYEAVRPLAIEWAGLRCKCALVEGKGKAVGSKVLDRTHRNYEAARKAAQRLMAVFTPPTAKVSHATEPVSLTRAQKQAATAFLAQFQGDTLDAQIKAAVRALRALQA